MFRLVALVLVVTVCCTVAQDGAELEDEKVTVHKNHSYFNPRAAYAAAAFNSYILKKYDCAVAREVAALRTQYTGHHQLIDECVTELPVTYLAEVKRAVDESLARLQQVDDQLRTLSALCFSLRVREPESCTRSKEQALESLEKAISTSEFQRVERVLKAATTDVKSYLTLCINVNINQ